MQQLRRGEKIVVASHNKGKLWEIRQLIAPFGLDAVSAGDLSLAEPEETEATFEGNALIKAAAAAEASGLPALADDSGLEVAALDGAPGIYSARWAGPEKDFSLAMQRVHDALAERGAWHGPAPSANFISVLCLAWPNGDHTFYAGRIDGHLVWPPRGGNGFGYDPMFVPHGLAATFGEMEPAAKYAISHRTRAFERFRAACLAGIGSTGEPQRHGRDLEALTAQAANLSTRAELHRFVMSLATDLGSHGSDWGPRTLAQFLDALAHAIEKDTAGEEPKWRLLAKLLLAASSPKAAP